MTEPLAKKSLGQHWLDDNPTLEAICDAADLNKDDVVLEIGPGHGTLTTKLLERAKQVIAVEKDESLSVILSNKFRDRAFYLSISDIMKFDLTSLPVNYKVVANIPYYLTSNLLRVLSESTNPPTVAVLLVQKEVAERVAAKPGKMSLLSVSAQFYWDVNLGIVVPARVFTPSPKVDSQVLVLKRLVKPQFDVDQKQFFRVVKAGFSARRKTLANSLAAGLRISKAEVLTYLATIGLNPNARPQELSPGDWFKIYQVFENKF